MSHVLTFVHFIESSKVNYSVKLRQNLASGSAVLSATFRIPCQCRQAAVCSAVCPCCLGHRQVVS